MQLNPRTYEAYNLFHEGALALLRAEQVGIRIDVDYLKRKKQYLNRKIESLQEDFQNTEFYQKWKKSIGEDPNINSSTQLSSYLYSVRKIKPKKFTEGGKGSVDMEALTELNLPELNDLIEIRKFQKMLSTYLEPFIDEQVNGVIHPFYHLHLVKTFRSSSSSPNWQNIPKRDEQAMALIRKAIYPRKGHQLLEMDFSKLEVSISCAYHKDSNMIKYMKNPKSNMHTDMALQIFQIDKWDDKFNILRQAVKNGFVFPQFYGDYYINNAESMACTWCKLPHGKWNPTDGIEIDGLEAHWIGAHMINHGIKSLSQFENYLRDIEYDFWNNRFPEYAAWKKRWWNLYVKYGYIDMLTGFRCAELMARNDCINRPIQGTAFHVNLKSFILIDEVMRKEKWDTRLIGEIHDSILLDVLPDELPHVIDTILDITCKKVPELWTWINVPLEVEFELCPVDKSWMEKEKLNLK